MGRQLRIRRANSRKGVAAVEFAFIAPVFLAVTLGMAQATMLFDTQAQLAVAAREGARLATMDRRGFLPEGQNINTKVKQDIESFLSANGISVEDVEIHIVDPEDHATEFDLADSDNNLELFELRVELPYSALHSSLSGLPDGMKLIARVVFRNARSTMVQ